MARKDPRPKRAGRKLNHTGPKPKSNRTNQKEEQAPGLQSINLEEKQPPDFQSISSYRHYKTTTSKAKGPSPTARPQIKPASDVNVKVIPVGSTLTVLPTGTFTAHTGALPLIPSSTPHVSTPGTTPGFSPLPPLASFAATSSVSSLLHETVPTESLEAKQRQVQSQPTKHVSTVAIALVAVGVAFLLLGIFIVFRICRRPRRRTCPTPSLPILQDPFTDEDVVGDEESLFGGKERASGRPESNVLWTWTQYSQPSLRKPEFTTAGLPERTGDAQMNVAPAKRNSTGFSEKRTSLTVEERSAAPSQLPMQQAHTALSRAANRVSAMSMSVYPGSPLSTAGPGIGVALGGASPLTADGMPVLQRSISKPSTQRLLKNRRSVRYSMYDPSQIGEDLSQSNPDVYDGAQVTSPVPSPNALPKSKSVQGRARVKTPYAPGVLRTSSSVSAFLGRDPNPFEDSQYILPPLSPALKTDALRERDTRALASALGLASPPPPSPQPTLYPDDSITRRQSRVIGHGRGQSEAMSPSMEASARLGNLMLADFTSMASLPSTRAISGSDQPPVRTKSTRKRADDKPPRVPSPPPMPSLAQMALAHTNPQDYADYRSPTYSIYGLYEADRKSRAPGEGGY